MKDNNLKGPENPNLEFMSYGSQIIQFASTVGLFLLPTEANKVKDKSSVYFPKTLLTNNFENYINLIMDDIVLNKIKATISDEQQVKMIVDSMTPTKKIIVKLFKNFSDGSNNNEIKFANIMYFIINIVTILFISVQAGMSDLSQSQLIYMAIINMFTQFLGQFPNDKCYFNKQQILLFEPNMCDIKSEKTDQTNYTLLLGGSLVLTIIIIIALIVLLNKSKKSKK